MEPVSRRDILTGVCAVAALSVTGLPAASASAVKKLADGRLSVAVKDLPALQEVGNSVRVGMLRGQAVGLARTGPSTFIAFSLQCPHQGVTVVKNENGWECKAHGSLFEPDGDLVFGPATTRLARVRSKVSAGKVILG